MTRTINKYALPMPGNVQQYRLAFPGRIVHVGTQNDQPHFWIEVPQLAVTFGTLEIWTIGTGWDVPPKAEHAGTLIDAGGFVWHFYARWL